MFMSCSYCLHLSDTCISMETIKCRYGIILSQMDYIFIDGVAVLILGYAMTLSYPEDKLGKVRPTSSLLGPLNVASVVGVWGINLVFLVGALCFMHTQTGYVKWPASYSHGASWWTLDDNWESTVIFFVMYFQFITSAFVYTFGSVFRKSVFLNWVLVVNILHEISHSSL
jgi:magnesium-transporting ATPase (P-type)